MDHSLSGLPDETCQGETLLSLARSSIGDKLGVFEPFLPDPAWLTRPGASFVTLTAGGDLRGCIGSLFPVRSLGEDVRYNAMMAAFRDPRFPPLSQREFREVRIGVSLLSPMDPLTFSDLADLTRKIRVGKGVLLRCGSRSTTYLPEVWEMLPDPEEFLFELFKKGGISPGVSATLLQAYLYTSTVWKED